MMDLLNTIFAYGPIGGIDAAVAVRWTVIWTVVLGLPLYVSLYYPQWLKMDDEQH